MSQAGISIANAAGAVFRAALNAALGAIVTNNSGATEPATTYPNMWWYDTANAQLKRRNNANDAWIVLGLEAASTDGTMAANSDSLVPTQKAAKTYADTKVASTVLDTDGTLVANSDAKVATQKATKTYADGKLSKTTAGEIAALTEKIVLADDDLFIVEDSASGNVKMKVKRSNLVPANIPVYVADDLAIVASSPSVAVNASSSYTKIKEIAFYGQGEITVSFDLRSTDSAKHVNARVYKNGVAIGTERLTPSETYTTYSQSFSGITNGDLIQIYAKGIPGQASANVLNFKICGSSSTKNLE